MSLIDKIVGAKWAVVPEVLQTILRVASRGPAIPKSEWPAYQTRQKRGAAEPAQGYRMAQLVGGVAVVPITGPIFPRANMMTEMSGATAISALKADFARAENDPSVRAILLDIDSPGGVVTGIDDFAARVAAAGKPVVTYVAGMAASAAYWIAAASREILADRSAELGSIGVRVAVTKQLETDQHGEMTFDIVSSGAPLKLPDPETEAGLAALQIELDDLEDLFVGSVAENRGVGIDTVRDGFGRGGIMIAAKAVAAGMADGIGTFEEAHARALQLAAEATAAPVPSLAPMSAADLGPPTAASILRRLDLLAAANAGLAADIKALKQPTESPAAQPGATDAGAIPVGPQQQELAMSTDPKTTGGPTPPAADATAPAPAPARSEAEIRAEAILAERMRIKAIQDATIPGHEALAQQYIADGKSPGDFALAQAVAEKAKGTAHLDARRAAAAALPAPQVQVPAPEGQAQPKTGTAPETDEEAKRAYAASNDLQKEFRSEAGYVAWAKASREGRVKIFRSKRDEQKAAA